MTKNMRGITLVSLVITIIVMLILAGVSISMATGNNGVLTQGQKGAVKTKLASIESDIGLALNGVQTNFFGDFAESTSKVGNKNTYLTPKRINEQTNECFFLVPSGSSSITSSSVGARLQPKYQSNSGSSFTVDTALTTMAGVSDGKSSTNSGSTGYISSVGYVCRLFYFSNGTSASVMGGDLYAILCHFNDGFFVIDDVGIAKNNSSQDLYQGEATDSNAKTKLNTNLQVEWLNNIWK